MRVPNANRAVVDIAKLRDYCLNPAHDVGKFKARVFRSALGLSQSGAPLLRQWLLEAIANLDAVEGRHDDFGARYTVDFTAQRNLRSARIRSAWIIRSGEDFPRLVSCYVI